MGRPKNLPATQETRVQSLSQEDPLEKGMATHSSILDWRIPWTEEPGGLQRMGLQCNLNYTCDEIRPDYHFDVTCQGLVPESIIAFLESTDFESAVRLAVSLGGDADTMGAITGGIAEAYYGGVPEHIRKEVLKRLPNEFIEVMQNFYHKFMEK